MRMNCFGYNKLHSYVQGNAVRSCGLVRDFIRV